ncbi:MAG: hypothetical protein DA328_00785 [Nitrososphaeraceae archaeon]|nr:hypothetical protein [Nitrososphaeraceae archaeon]
MEVFSTLRLFHISDTHLGKRPRRTRTSLVNSKFRPIEDDFYNSWIDFVDYIVELPDSRRPDLVIHSGDFFDTPSGTDPFSPPEFSRKVTAETLLKLNQTQIPIVIVDGNHGRYMQYQVSPLSEYSIIFDNVHLFTHFDIKEAIRNNKPLYKDFAEFNLRVHAHPSIETNDIPQLFAKYEEWIYTQNKNIDPEMINVNVVHGMVENKTLHKDAIYGGKYDYIAMGDNHKMQEVSYNAWYAGSPQLWSFSEYDDKKGFLVVEIDTSNDKYVNITPKIIPLRRKIISEKIKLFYEDTNSQIITRAIEIFNKNGLCRKYDYQSSARVRLVFEGEKLIGPLFNIHEIMTYLNRVSLDDDEYNISEFIMDFSNFLGDPIGKNDSSLHPDLNDNYCSSEKFNEYLIENPEKEFKEYICSNRENDLIKNNINPDYLANLFLNAIQSQSNSNIYGHKNSTSNDEDTNKIEYSSIKKKMTVNENT